MTLENSLKKVKKALEVFYGNNKDTLPQTDGVYIFIAAVKGRDPVIISGVKFDSHQMGINVETIEKILIHKAMLETLKKKDKLEQKEQKKLIKSQIAESKKSNKK